MGKCFNMVPFLSVFIFKKEYVKIQTYNFELLMWSVGCFYPTCDKKLII